MVSVRTPDKDGERPPQPLSNESVATAGNQNPLLACSVDDDAPKVEEPGPQLRRRRAASWRLVPLDQGLRDPFDRTRTPPGPSDFSLTRAELTAEVDRCRGLGWADWELVIRFTDPKQAAA